VRTNDVAIVLGEKETRLSLSREHAEVILPEVDHDFVELTVARHSASKLRRLNFACELLCLTSRGRKLRILTEDLLPSLCLVHRRVAGVGPFDLALQLLHDVVVANDVARLHVEDRVSSQELVGFCVVDALRVKLQLDPLIDAHASHFLRVTGARAEGETVERLLNLFVGQQFLRLARRYRNSGRRSAWLRRLGAAGGGSKQERNDVMSAHVRTSIAEEVTAW